MNSLSFREKTILGTLTATIAVNAGYFVNVWPQLMRGAELIEFLWPAIGAVVATVIIHVVNYVLIASTDVEVPRDERDRMIDVRATWWAHGTLYVGCVLGIGTVILASVMGLPLHAAFLVHGISIALTLSDITRYCAQLAGYWWMA